MQLLVVTAAADQTGRTISLLVAGLVGIAVALAALTVWYWRHTDPRRRSRFRTGPEPKPVEMIEPRQHQVGPVDIEIGSTVAKATLVGEARPIVASKPPSSTPPVSLPLSTPPPSPPSSNKIDHRVVETGRGSSREWVDPEAWVNAFASEAGAPASPTSHERPSVVPQTVSPTGEVILQSQPIDPEPRRDPVQRLPYVPESEPQPEKSEPQPVGHSLSDVEWDAVTQAALDKFAEIDGADSVDTTDPSSVR